MNFSSLLVSCLLLSFGGVFAAAQNPPAEPAPKGYAPTDVVANIMGKDYTAEEIEWMRKNMPPDLAKQTDNMTYAGFLESLAMQMALAQRAEEMKLAEKEPYHTRLEINQRIFLANAFLAEIQQALNFNQDDYRAFYEKNKSDYEDLRVSGIYINYALDPSKAPEIDGKKALNEQEAWGKAQEILVELRQGADFTETAKKRSDDPAAAEKGGDLGTFKKDSKIPEVLKNAIFALKDGDVSEPVKYGGRFYIFKIMQRQTVPYTEALPSILQRIQDVKIKERLDQIRQETAIEIKNEAFANTRPGATKSAPAPGQAAPVPQ